MEEDVADLLDPEQISVAGIALLEVDDDVGGKGRVFFSLADLPVNTNFTTVRGNNVCRISSTQVLLSSSSCESSSLVVDITHVPPAARPPASPASRFESDSDTDASPATSVSPIGSVGSGERAPDAGGQRFHSLDSTGVAARVAALDLKHSCTDLPSTTTPVSPGARAPRKPKQLDRFLVGDEIGRGSFAVVFSGLDSESGGLVAIKRVPLRVVPPSPRRLTAVALELELLKEVVHENIVRYVGILQTARHVHFVLEFMEGGSLASMLIKFGKLPERLVRMYLQQALAGVAHLHACGIVHRDIKCSNILLTKHGRVKLADFGIAARFSPARCLPLETARSPCARTPRAGRGSPSPPPVSGGGGGGGEDGGVEGLCGSPNWIAPEVVLCQHATAACDIWSVGCAVVELLCGVPPYADLTATAVMEQMVAQPHPPLPDDASPAVQSFLLQCFTRDPRLRPPAQDLLLHPFLAASPPPPQPTDDAPPPRRSYDPPARQSKGLRKGRCFSALSPPAPLLTVPSPRDPLGWRRDADVAASHRVLLLPPGRTQQAAPTPASLALPGEPQPAVLAEDVSLAAYHSRVCEAVDALNRALDKQNYPVALRLRKFIVKTVTNFSPVQANYWQSPAARTLTKIVDETLFRVKTELQQALQARPNGAGALAPALSPLCDDGSEECSDSDDIGLVSLGEEREAYDD